MDKFDRIQHLHRIFKNRRLPVPVRVLAEELECSERNVKRLLETMQLVDAPLVYDESGRGWRYEKNEGDLFELPGLWLTGDELQSLSLLLSLLEQLGNGILNDEIVVIEKEVTKLLNARGIDPSAFADRVRVLPIAHRQLPGTLFNKVSEALLRSKRVRISYLSYRGEKTSRDISPQTLVHYRENWYIDAWCHLRNALRTFSIARVSSAEILKTNSKVIAKETLREHFASSFGIFAGTAKHTAKLRFSREIAREIATQQWHPQQQGEWDGADYLLSIPYSDDRELLQDLLRHTPHVYVEAPVKLRKKLQNKLQQGLEIQLGKGLGWL